MTVDGSEINLGLIRTNENCRGCNKCISACPVFSANIAIEENGVNKIYVDQRRCIACGRCMDFCTHDARIYIDDTERFFDDLADSKAGTRDKKISVIIAPSFVTNYPHKYKLILGYLKSLGVNHVFNVSTGADISIWGYIKYIEENPRNGIIAQPCPAIVNGITMYYPELISRLIPIQSPAMCTAIYMKKYMGITDDIVFISPCIAKKSEIERAANENLIEYNVTFDHLLNRISDVDVSDYEPADAEADFGMGALFPKQGGLRENMEYYLGISENLFINQKEGEDQAYGYLDLYNQNVDYDDPLRARVIDILSCTGGCNFGTATEFKHVPSNHISYTMNKIRVEKKRGMTGYPNMDELKPHERLSILNERFANLDIADFCTSYNAISVPINLVPQEEVKKIFRKMLKFTNQEETMDCTSCGFNSCKDMATAIALGNNYRENCVEYVKKELLIEHSEKTIQKQRIEILQKNEDAEKANIDHLTGLGDRYLFTQKLEFSLKKMRVVHKAGYVFCVDFDDFMDINEGYGHNFGDALLVEFASYLRSQFQSKLSLFRIDGDEFALITEAIDSKEALRIADQLLIRAQEAWEIMGIRFYCTMSIGIARFPDADDGVNEIIKNVDRALYDAKANGKSNYVIFDRQVNVESWTQINMTRQMRDDISNGFKGFEVHYQPWVSKSGEIIGAEALLRWKDENGRNVSPGEFIPIAENVGLIVPLGEFVLYEAAMQCKKVNKQRPGFLISINVSAKQFNSPTIIENFMDILRDTGVDMSNIVLEITESLEIESISRQRQIFEKFIEYGLKVALDDFGTGYSSLSYLNELPFNLIKIDRSFIEKIETDDFSRYLVITISELMRQMGRMVCVEGVETERQVEFCIENEIDILQGFYCYRPMPAQELDKLILHSDARGKA